MPTLCWVSAWCHLKKAVWLAGPSESFASTAKQAAVTVMVLYMLLVQPAASITTMSCILCPATSQMHAGSFAVSIAVQCTMMSCTVDYQKTHGGPFAHSHDAVGNTMSNGGAIEAVLLKLLHQYYLPVMKFLVLTF